MSAKWCITWAMLRKGIIASPASTVRTWTKERHRRASVDVTIVELLRNDEIGLRKSISSLITIHREESRICIECKRARWLIEFWFSGAKKKRKHCQGWSAVIYKLNYSGVRWIGKILFYWRFRGFGRRKYHSSTSHLFEDEAADFVLQRGLTQKL